MKTFIDNCAALTIAGSDSGGGAGIQADLKTFSAFGVFGTSVITAVTAQNLKGVFAIQPIDPEVVQKQLMAVLEGFPIKAIKTGMLFSAEIIAIIADTLANPQYAHIPIIIDPVFAATSGGKLIKDEAIRVLTGKLFPKAALITPNMPETEILLDQHLETPGHLEQAAIELFTRFNVPVLMNNHGSGCTLSSAIAGSIAGGQGRLTLSEAIHIAKMYITRALENSLELSPGLRVINHSVCS
ncbi:MAG: hydroxymethylpyrimidine/phosphomethylpyrimidine kinase [Acidobacteria bacterium]|nr:hydroxymethylpyrimidine/phosphomethylpyrimidine kinase [Acidobacteriota bacterium]